MTDLDEPILPDDYPVYFGYAYIADGRLISCPLGAEGSTVAHLKQAIDAQEIRRCDIVGRGVVLMTDLEQHLTDLRKWVFESVTDKDARRHIIEELDHAIRLERFSQGIDK